VRVTKKLAAIALSAVLALGAGRASAESGGGPLDFDIRDNASDEIAAMHPAMVAKAAALGAPVTNAVPTAGAALFQYPLQQTPAAGGFVEEAISNYVDHDPGVGVRDFDCGTRTYNGHEGTDIFLAPFPWSIMDKREDRVVAALPGVIVDKHDGEFDSVDSKLLNSIASESSI